MEYVQYIAKAGSKFWRDQRGVTAIEYVLIASLVAVAIVVGVTAIGVNLGNTFNTATSHL